MSCTTAIPASCYRHTGAGERGDSCPICFSTFQANTPSIVHRSCKVALCATCFLSWYITRGPESGCPYCRERYIPAPAAPQAPRRPNTRQQAAQQAANQAAHQAAQQAVLDAQIEAVYQRQKAEDIETIVNRMARRQTPQWFALRPSLIVDIRRKLTELSQPRRIRAREEVLDDREEEADEAIPRRPNTITLSGQRGSMRRLRRNTRSRLQREERDAIYDQLTDWLA